MFSIIFVLTLIYFFGVRFANAIDQKINNPKPKIPIVFIRWFIYIVLSYIAFNVEFIDPSLLDALLDVFDHILNFWPLVAIVIIFILIRKLKKLDDIRPLVIFVIICIILFGMLFYLY